MLFAGSRREDFDESSRRSLLSAFFHLKGDNRGYQNLDKGEKKKVNKGARMLNNVQQEKL